MELDKIQKVVVVGSGTMGPGIAQTFARAGLDVFLVDLNNKILERGLQQIRENLSLFLEMGIILPSENESILKRVHITTDMESACREADYFMEAVPEVRELKQKVHSQADNWCRPEVILATNASNMKIDQLASATGRPDRVVGNHWVNPPHIMQLVEIVKGSETSDETIKTSRALLESIGKAPIVCKDTLSYLNNDMQFGLRQKALDLWQNGIATPEDIDQAVNCGFGFRLPLVGPLAFLDMAGLDNVKCNWEYMNSMTGGSWGPLPEAIQKCIDAGNLGLKTGKGIYDYSGMNVKELTKDRNRQLILMLKVLGRI